MGSCGFPVLTALLLFATEYEVSAQYASVVECIPATTATVARPIVQTGGQYILPAIIQPIVPSYDYCAPDSSYSNNGNFPAPIPSYPIIIENNKDIWRDLLYFLMFALQNKKMNSIINSQNNCGCNSCNCCGSCNCGCCCNNNNNNNNQNNVQENNNNDNAPTYIPVPVAIPVLMGSDGCSCIDALSGFGNDIVIQGSPVQCNGNEPSEINLFIRAER